VKTQDHITMYVFDDDDSASPPWQPIGSPIQPQVAAEEQHARARTVLLLLQTRANRHYNPLARCPARTRVPPLQAFRNSIFLKHTRES